MKLTDSLGDYIVDEVMMKDPGIKRRMAESTTEDLEIVLVAVAFQLNRMKFKNPFRSWLKRIMVRALLRKAALYGNTPNS